MTKPPNEKLSNTNDTPGVKVRTTHDRLGKRSHQFQLQGMLLNAVDDCLKDRKETFQQYITDLIEADLVKNKYLPNWWYERGRGIR